MRVEQRVGKQVGSETALRMAASTPSASRKAMIAGGTEP
jgi:hypothetical protein